MPGTETKMPCEIWGVLVLKTKNVPWFIREAVHMQQKIAAGVLKPKCLVKIGAHAIKFAAVVLVFTQNAPWARSRGVRMQQKIAALHKIANFLYQFVCMVLKTKNVYHCGYGTNCQASIAKNCVPFAYRC